MKNLKERYGRWALVTGASSGIGRSISRKLAEQGFNLVMVARNEINLEILGKDLVSNFKIEIKTIAADLSTNEGNEKVIEQTTEIDIGLLVANAGVENNGPFIENDADAEHSMTMLNVLSPMMLSRAC